MQDINDNAPQFNQSEYSFSISEGLYESFHLIGQVRSHDLDDGDNAVVEYNLMGYTQSGVCYLSRVSKIYELLTNSCSRSSEFFEMLWM